MTLNSWENIFWSTTACSCLRLTGKRWHLPVRKTWNPWLTTSKERLLWKDSAKRLKAMSNCSLDSLRTSKFMKNLKLSLNLKRLCSQLLSTTLKRSKLPRRSKMDLLIWNLKMASSDTKLGSLTFWPNTPHLNILRMNTRHLSMELIIIRFQPLTKRDINRGFSNSCKTTCDKLKGKYYNIYRKISN